jgi:hypothetical protein
MLRIAWLLWVIFYLSVTNPWICWGADDDKTATRIRKVKSNWTHYRHLAQLKAPLSREVERNSFLKKHHGVYKDVDRNKRLGLTDTIIVIVQLVQKQANNPQPKMALLNNMICHLERHGLTSVVYLSRYLFNSTTHPVHSHFVPNDNMLYMPYPDLMFWEMLLAHSKTSSISPKQAAKHPYPNFKEHGDKAVLFAVLELLKANLNVILLDDDVMLLRDPIPFLINNHITADIVTPEDTRQCTFLASPLLDVSKWKHIQPEINLGVTFFRSRVALIQLVQRWMNLVVHNGQKAFFPFRRIVETDNSCHTRRRRPSPLLAVDSAPATSSDTNPNRYSNPLSICYLSNTLFQNGFMNSFRCGKYNRHPVYVLTLSEEILAHRDYFSPHNSLAKVAKHV